MWQTTKNTIRKIVIATAEVTTLAGSGDKGYVNATGENAKFWVHQESQQTEQKSMLRIILYIRSVRFNNRKTDC